MHPYKSPFRKKATSEFGGPRGDGAWIIIRSWTSGLWRLYQGHRAPASSRRVPWSFRRQAPCYARADILEWPEWFELSVKTMSEVWQLKIRPAIPGPGIARLRAAATAPWSKVMAAKTPPNSRCSARNRYFTRAIDNGCVPVVTEYFKVNSPSVPMVRTPIVFVPSLVTYMY